jgi:hypothetical protein
MSKLLLEVVSPDYRILKEEVNEKTGKKTMWVEVKWQHVDKINGNRRRYPKAVMQREMDRLKPEMDKGAVYGASYHPEGDAEVDDVSHLWESTSMDPNGQCLGVVKVIPTARGENVQVILDNGGYIGMSSRGYGTTTIKEEEIDGKKVKFEEINEDFRLKSPGDFVLSPSVEGAGVIRMLESRIKDGDSENKIEENKMTIDELRAANPEAFKAVDEELQAIKLELETLKTSIGALQTEKQTLIDNIRSVISSLADIEGIVPGVPEEKEDLTKLRAEAEKALADANKLLDEAKEEAAKAKAETEKAKEEGKKVENEKALDAKIKALMEAETAEYQKLIKDALGLDKDVTAENIDEKVKLIKEQIATQKANILKEQILKDGVGSRGVIPDPEGKKPLDESGMRSRYAAAVKAGYNGTLAEYVKIDKR